ncbi:MAG: hypothetical protein ACYTX0_31380 [Nostoc sp.]
MGIIEVGCSPNSFSLSMSVFSRNNLITYCCVGIVGLALIAKNSPQNQAANATNNTNLHVEKPSDLDDESDSPISIIQQNRPLRMSISVDNPSFLKVRVGQEIKKGDVITGV